MTEFDARVKPTIAVHEEDGGDGRSRLVRIPRGADATIFGGWGVKI